MRIPLWVYALVVALAVLLAYGFDVGSGFIKEDASWILRSRIGEFGDVRRLLTHTGGFFRPAVALSFAVNEWMFGTSPLGYGWTNLLLAAAAAFAVYRLAVALELPRPAALLAAAVWILNFHGIGMAVLWLSGRTALLLVLFAVLAATAAARGRLVWMCVWMLLALCSKEEAILLPVVLAPLYVSRPGAAGLAVARRSSAGEGGRATIALAAVLVVYSLLRASSDAFTPFTAPSFYRFTFDPSLLWKNIIEYADRALTLTAAVVVLACLVAGRLPTPSSHQRRLIAIAALWVAAGYGLTIFLPVRSSLYACLPSVGAAIAGAVLVTSLWDGISIGRGRALSALAIVLPLALVPVYWRRNDRWIELGRVSTHVLDTFDGLTRANAQQLEVIIVDDMSARANVTAALGWAVPDAVEFTTGRRPRVSFVPRPADAAVEDQVRVPPEQCIVLAFRDGRLAPAPADAAKKM